MLEGAMEPKTIAERSAKLGFPAIAVTDRNGLYGVMPFSDACFSKGVQPIIRAMLAVARPEELVGQHPIDWLVLLAKDDEGYGNLCKLVSSAHLDRPVAGPPLRTAHRPKVGARPPPVNGDHCALGRILVNWFI